jgi:transposase InsO family protein
VRKRFRSTTDSNHGSKLAEDLLNREFDVASSNEVWFSDITYISTVEGWLYLYVVIDLINRARDSILRHEENHRNRFDGTPFELVN